MFRFGVLVLVSLAVALGAAAPSSAGTPDLAALVDPLIGTAHGAGRTFPGAVVPFGMVQFSPVTARTPDYSGYRYDDPTLRGFALTRMSGAGCFNYGDFPITPLLGPFDAFDPASPQFATSFSHRREHASPGRYEVGLDSGIAADLTATRRTGFASFRFPSAAAWLAIDASGEPDLRRVVDVEVVDEHTVRGAATTRIFCGGPTDVTTYFVAQFDRPIASFGTWGEDGAVRDGASTQHARDRAGALLQFELPPGRTLRAKFGLSHVSLANAALNLRRESPGWDGEALARRARASWNTRLATIAVDGGSASQRRTFYTALYHSLIHPTVASDVNGQYVGRDGRVRTARGYTRYTNISGWDIYRTQVPLLALIAPGVARDLVRSLLAGAGEAGGRLSRWELGGRETGVMVGDPALPIIAGAYAFGVRGFDTRAALSAMTRAASTAVPGPYFYPSLNQDNPVDASGRPVDAYVERPALADYLRLGYVPYDHGSGFLWGPAATTLEYALADFSLARFASSIGAGAAAEPFARRAQSWRSLLDPSTGYVEPRMTDGGFVTDSSHTSTDGFVEGNSSQYTWLVPQNVAGLATAIGGDAAAAARLDRLFARFGRSATSPNAWLGNAPSLGTPWLYLWLGRPWRTQAVVAAVRSRLFGAYPAGLPGDDDLGTTSAWYVWSALGLYPAIPGVGGLAVGSPLFPHARVRTALGTLDVAASGEGPYVRGLALDGRPSARTWIDVARLRGAHELRFELRPRPQRWGAGTSARPPSFG